MAVREEIMMASDHQRQAQENRRYVRRLLEEKQPDFAVVLESVERELSSCPICQGQFGESGVGCARNAVAPSPARSAAWTLAGWG